VAELWFFTIHKHLYRLQKIQPLLDCFSFLVAISIFSSQIGGSHVGLHDCYRFQEMGMNKTKSIQEIDDLIKTYQYARKVAIIEKRLLTAHKYPSPTLLAKTIITRELTATLSTTIPPCATTTICPFC